MEIRLRDEIRAGLGHVVRIAAQQRRVLGVGQPLVLTVGLVARRHDDALDARGALAGRLEQRPGPANVRLEGGERRPAGRADDGLRAEMEDRVDLVLVQRAQHHREILELSPHQSAAGKGARPEGLAVRHPVPDEADDGGVPPQQLSRDPRSQ